MTHTEVTIQGMSCQHCVAKVRKALQALPEVNVNSISVGSASLDYDESRVTREQIVEAIRQSGYTVAA